MLGNSGKGVLKVFFTDCLGFLWRKVVRELAYEIYRKVYLWPYVKWALLWFDMAEIQNSLLDVSHIKFKQICNMTYEKHGNPIYLPCVT
jgi:hypothetical protein